MENIKVKVNEIDGDEKIKITVNESDVPLNTAFEDLGLHILTNSELEEILV